MALIWDWEKRKPAGLSGFKNREMLWLWCKLEENGYHLNQNLLGSATSRAEYLIDSIADKETLGSLRQYRNECFSKRLDDSEFKWIDCNNKRLVYWFLESLEGRYFGIGPALTSFDQSVLKPQERIELAFDLSFESIPAQKEIMSNFRQAWSILIEVDPSLKWIDKKNDEQCRWLVDEIRRSDLAPWISQSMQFPVTNEDRYLLIVNALDRSGFPLKLKTLFLGELKSRWNRKNKKEDTDKVQCNLNVSPVTKKHIKKLADNRNLKMGELIDALVAEEMERSG